MALAAGLLEMKDEDAHEKDEEEGVSDEERPTSRKVIHLKFVMLIFPLISLYFVFRTSKTRKTTRKNRRVLLKRKVSICLSLLSFPLTSVFVCSWRQERQETETKRQVKDVISTAERRQKGCDAHAATKGTRFIFVM